jgi:AraC-like DNA-binding protein
LIILHHALPHPPLSDFVEIFWLYEADTPSPPTKERRLPDGSMELVINLRDDLVRIYDRHHPDQFHSYRGSIISGVHSQFTLIDTTSQASVIGIHFKPGGAFPFLPLPAAELHNQTLSLDILWGIEAVNLREQLLTAQKSAHRFHILEQFLLSRLAPSQITHSAISFALKEFQNSSHTSTISAVTKQIGISQTRFIQLFRETVGLTPKQFCRILRFQQALQALENGLPIKWADLALSCGYFDQAHFIHDFQAFSGMTPGTYLSLRSEHRNHIVLPD